MKDFPEILDIARENRLFLYRAVRFLAQEAGVRQFLDLGSGLPAQQNVHEVAQRFRPDARVVYVDNDPIVLAHGRALLADDKSTAFIPAEMTASNEVWKHEDTRNLLDITQPVSLLFLSVPHSIADDNEADAMCRRYIDVVAPGSCIALTQIVSPDEETAAEMSAFATSRGMPWKTRTPDQVRHFLRDLEPVEPGFVDIGQWRPDPHQPPLSPVDPAIEHHLGAAAKDRRFMEYGALARKP